MSTHISAPPPPAHSLFAEEWHARFGTELDHLIQHWNSTGLRTDQIESCYSAFSSAHPPRFEGVYCSPTIGAVGDLTEVPPLVQADDLWIGSQRDQPPRRVHAIIPIPYHRLVALVTDTELIILRADELAQAQTNPKHMPTVQPQGGCADMPPS